MAATLDLINKVLHIYYARYLTSTTNDRTTLRDLITKDTRKFDGSILKLGLVDSFPATGGNLGPGATIPSAGQSIVDTTNVYLAYSYFPIEIDWDVEEQSSGPHAWIRASALEIERVRKWALLHFERMIASDGSGIIAGEPNPAATNLLPLINITSIAPVTFTVDKTYGIRFYRGQRLEFWDTGGASPSDFETFIKRDGPTSTSHPAGLEASQTWYTINTVSHSGNTTTVTTFDTATAGANEPGDNQATYYDVVTQAGAVSQDYYGGTNNASHETAGLSLITDNTNWKVRPSSKSGFTPTASTFQDVASSNAFWQGQVVDAGYAKILGPGLFEDVSMELQLTGSKGIEDIDLIATHPLQTSKYRRTLYPQERYTVTGSEPPDLPGGAKSSMVETKRYPTWGGIPICSSRYINPDEALFLNLNHVKVYENTPFKFAAADGSMWHRSPAGRASYRAVAYKYESVGVDSRNVHCKVKKLDVTRV